MKRLVGTILLPSVIAAAVVFFLATTGAFKSIFALQPEVKKNDLPVDSILFVDNFVNFPQMESAFIRSGKEADNIFLLGSSELTSGGDALPFNFVSKHYTSNVIGVGHAGNQCFSIYSQLLANGEMLNGAPVVIVLSPMWFMDNYANGTAAPLFLEFNSEHFIEKINALPESEFKDHELKRIADMFGDLTSPHLQLRQAFLSHQASKHVINKILYAPLQLVNSGLIQLKKITANNHPSVITLARDNRRKPLSQDPVRINWDSLFTASKQEVLTHSTNNTWGVDDEYFTTYVNGGQSKFNVPGFDKNQEWKDFEMLIKLLKAKKVNASFIILPMNPYYYSTIKDLDPVVSGAAKLMNENGFPTLNYWVTDTAKFEKGILKDVMHLSSAGWYKADKFIIDTYKLQK